MQRLQHLSPALLDLVLHPSEPGQYLSCKSYCSMISHCEYHSYHYWTFCGCSARSLLGIIFAYQSKNVICLVHIVENLFSFSIFSICSHYFLILVYYLTLYLYIMVNFVCIQRQMFSGLIMMLIFM